MRPEDTPWLNARSLRMQIDAVLPVVEDRAATDPDHKFSARVLGKLLTILAVIREQYGSRLIQDHEILELLMVQAPKELPAGGLSTPSQLITAEEMRLLLASVHASLLALEDLEAHTTPYGSTAATEVPPPWSPATEDPDSPPGQPGNPPGQPGNWRGEPGDRQYRIGAGRRYRRAAAYWSSDLPW
jgi:hypothetical protein